MVEGSKEEALLGIDLYNRPLTHGSFHGFVVHMHLAWLYLLHAEFQRDRIDYHYRLPNGRFERIDGEPRTWDLARSAKERWLADSPVRKNIEFFIGLRNKIEHRFQRELAIATAGEIHAWVINYETELTSKFGSAHSLSDRLRFPLFLSALTGGDEVGATVKAAVAGLPKRAREFLITYRAGLDPTIAEDQRYEFRLRLVPALGAKTEADLAVEFVRLDDLTDEEREVMLQLGKTGKVVVREQKRPVANLDLLRPTDATRTIQAELDYKFTSFDFLVARERFKVRPPAGAKHPEKTVEQYCVYDQAHGDYLYTEALVKKVLREIDTREKYEAFFGRPARSKNA